MSQAARITLRSARPLLVALALVSAACGRHAEGDQPDDQQYLSDARLVDTLTNFNSPEAVLYDAELDVFYVSNIMLFGSVKANNGYITRVSAADYRNREVLVQGGRNGVDLHAPKGLMLHGDTLWTADIDALRGFHRITGALLAVIDFQPHAATLLNDLDVGPDGSIRVTDTGIVMGETGIQYDTTGSRIFIVGPGRSITAIAAGEPYPNPNGIRWDASGQRWVVVTFPRHESHLYVMRQGDTARSLLASGRGRWDGVRALADGRVLVSSWSDSSIRVLVGDSTRQVIRRVPQPAAFAIDTRRNRIAIPLVMDNRVEVWTVPSP